MDNKTNHSEITLSELNRKIDKIDSEVNKIEILEKSLAQHELVLARKIRDMYEMEKKLEKLVPKKEFDEIKKDLKEIEKEEKKDEDILFENTKFMKELVMEINKIKQSHILTRNYVMGGENVRKKDFEKHMDKIKDSIKSFDDIAEKHKEKADKTELKKLQEEMHDRMSQIEYQHKFLLNLFKKKMN